MEDSDQIVTIVLFFSFIILACRQGEKTTYKDKDIDDYWSGD
jgi:hypothetical protein